MKESNRFQLIWASWDILSLSSSQGGGGCVCSVVSSLEYPQGFTGSAGQCRYKALLGYKDLQNFTAVKPSIPGIQGFKCYRALGFYLDKLLFCDTGLVL